MEKKTNVSISVPILPPEICNMIFFLNPEFHKTVEMEEDDLLIVFGIRNYRSSNEVVRVLVDRKRLNSKIRIRKGTFK
jgi:hypothetical protein